MCNAQHELANSGNQNTHLLKLIALVFMCCDHAGKVFFGSTIELRVIGRIAFPIYCYCAALGACYTRSFPRYILRLLAVGVLSQPFYMLALTHPWYEFNIFATLCLGVCALYGIRAKWRYSHLWGPAAALLLSSVIRCDYGWKGVLLIILLYVARRQKSSLIAVMIAFCLFWGSGSRMVTSLFGIPLTFLNAALPDLAVPLLGHSSVFLNSNAFRDILSPFFALQTFALLALPFILIPMKTKIKMPQWLNYAFYPLHLAVIALIKAFV